MRFVITGALVAASMLSAQGLAPAAANDNHMPAGTLDINLKTVPLDIPKQSSLSERENGESAAGYSFREAPVLVSDYNFLPQQPIGTGGVISAGNNALIFTPVPLGVNGTDSNHYLYIRGGAETAEACLITGGTGTAGQASGQILLNCSHKHSGAWLVQSATGGITECIAGLGASGGTCLVPRGIYPIHATITANVPHLTIAGTGWGAVLLRQSDLGTKSIVSQAADDFVLRDITVDDNNLSPAGGPATVAIVDYGTIDHVRFNAAGAEIEGGITLSIGAAHVKVLNSEFIGPNDGTNGAFFAMWFDSEDSNDILIAGNSVHDYRGNATWGSGENIRIIGNDIYHNHCQHPAGGGQVGLKDETWDLHIVVANNTIHNGCATASSGIEADARNELIVDNVIYGHAGQGIVLQTGPGVQVIGNQISGNAQDGIIVDAGISNFSIVGNRITGNSGIGLLVNSPASNNYIIGDNVILNNGAGNFHDSGIGCGSNGSRIPGLSRVGGKLMSILAGLARRLSIRRGRSGIFFAARARRAPCRAARLKRARASQVIR
jgi:hypothetical protein